MAKQESFSQALVSKPDPKLEGHAFLAQLVVFVNTVMLLVVAFGVSVSGLQQAAIMATVNAGVVLWAAWKGRGNAVPNEDPDRFIDPMPEGVEDEHVDPDSLHG